VLLFAHPLHPHGAAGYVRRDERGIGRRVVRAVVAVAARALHVDHAHLFDWQAKHFGNGLTIGIASLGVGPDRHALIIGNRHGAGRPHGCVHLVGPGECRLVDVT